VCSYEEIDFFTDVSLLGNPYPYFDYLRSKGPVCRLPRYNAVAVTGHEEALAVFSDPATFSSVNSANGPIPDLPFVPEGNDIREQVARFRPQMYMAGQVVTQDGFRHSMLRSLLMQLFMPNRLKALEQYLRDLSNELIDTFSQGNRCELMQSYATPYATLVIADLLGVPEEDRRLFRDRPPNVSGDERLQFLATYFHDYISDRRRNPRNDIMSQITSAKYPDGSTPTITDMVNLACTLFAAGQDTTAKILCTSMRLLAERPDLQTLLRDENQRIPDFVEEMLRFDGPIKIDSRLVLRTTTLGGVDLKAGTTVCLFLDAINRDPRRHAKPAEIELDRPKAREHLAFGRGAHTCAGAPLARTELRISLSRLLTRLHDIRIDEAVHGPRPARRFEYVPSYILRGLKELHLEFTAAERASAD
jgi:cytochrome P450